MKVAALIVLALCSCAPYQEDPEEERRREALLSEAIQIGKACAASGAPLDECHRGCSVQPFRTDCQIAVQDYEATKFRDKYLAPAQEQPK